MVTNKSSKIECELYKGFLFKYQSVPNKKIVEYKKAIDIFHQNINKPYDGSKLPEKQEEILSQAILIKAMPNHKIVMIDDGSESSQVDLIAENEKGDIAIEITQFAEKNYSILKSKENGLWPAKNTKRKWVVHINNNHGVEEISKKEIEHINNCLSTIEKSFDKSEGIIIYLDAEVKQEIKEEVAALKEKRVTYIYGDKEDRNGAIQLVLGGFSSFSITSLEAKREVLKGIIEIATITALKKDILKKFEGRVEKEKHLFIPVTFSFDKGKYIEWYLEYFEFFKKDTTNLFLEGLSKDIKEKAEAVFEIVDIVWISFLYHWLPSGRMGFSLIKIVKCDGNFVFHSAFYKEAYPIIAEQFYDEKIFS